MDTRETKQHTKIPSSSETIKQNDAITTGENNRLVKMAGKKCRLPVRCEPGTRNEDLVWRHCDNLQTQWAHEQLQK